MQCDDFREIADSYLSDELLIETNHDVIRHLDSCANCRFELASRQQLRHQLRTQFNQTGDLQPRGEFVSTLKNQLRDQAVGRSRIVIPRLAYVGIAATILLATVVGLLAVQSWRNSRRELLAWTNLTKSAVGDHRECALEHKLGPTIIDLKEAGRTYDPAFANLANALTSEGALPAGAQLIGAHSCEFQGRRFAHLVIKFHDQVASILVAKTVAPNNRAPIPQPGDLVTPLKSDSYRIASFQTAGHAVFVASGLSENDNMTLARSVAPALAKHLARAEQTLDAHVIGVIKRGE
jgi:anti-sigma factor RsiW